jgi:acetyl-CoA synthetase
VSEKRTSGRPVYSHAQLRRALSPDSIAIVGSSPRAGSFGQRVADNLRQYDGCVYHVNPRYPSIGDQACFPDFKALPEVPDCAVLVTGADSIEPLVQEAVAAGVGGLVVFASGFAETGKTEQVALQKRIAALVAGTQTRLIGPNCIGIYNYVRNARLAFSPTPPNPRPLPFSIGIVSQSGAMGSALAQAMEHGTSICYTLTAGNSCDVDVADLVSYLAEDDNCSVIACMFEGLAEPRRFLEAAAKAWKADKPLIVYKMATGAKGAAAAMSHTGSLAGAGASYRAAFERAGIVEVASSEDVIETAMFFAKAPRTPLARGAAVISTSGGAGIVAADKAEIHGVDLPEFTPETEAILASMIPDFGSPRNPCDITGQVLNNADALGQCAEAIYAEKSVGVGIYPHPLAYDAATPRIAALGEVAARHGKPFCTVWMNQWLEGPGARDAEVNPNAIIFRSMDRCFGAIARWLERADRREKGLEPGDRTVAAADRDAVASLLRASNERVVGESDAKTILARYGVKTVPERLVASEDAARAAATEFGYPVVLKVESPDIPHKTEAGMVFLDLRTEEAMVSAYRAIIARADSMSPRPRLNGVVVQAMIPKGLELVVGGQVDPMFGPMVVFGFGGVLIELLRDSVSALAPISQSQAKAMLGRLKGYKLLTGFRGSAAVDLDSFAEVIARVSEFLADHAGDLSELDINPLIATPGGLVAVDALIVRKPQD